MNRFIIDFAILPLIGAIHGYITNKIAIWMLFNPKEPFIIPIINVKIQGLLPKRKEVIADSLADVVENDLFSQDDIKKYIIDNELFVKSIPTIHKHIMDKIEKQLPRWITSGIKKYILEYLSNIVMKELFELNVNIAGNIEELETMIPIKDIVKEKIMKLNFDELEQLIRKIAKKELSFIEWLGFYMGLFIGFVQGIFLIIVGH